MVLSLKSTKIMLLRIESVTAEFEDAVFTCQQSTTAAEIGKTKAEQRNRLLIPPMKESSGCNEP